MATLTDNVTEWIEANHDRPFFVYYAPNAVHEPMVPNPKFTGSRYGKYGDFIGELDWSVGQILDKLDQLKLTDNTLVIFTSDNGGVVAPGNPNASGAIKAGLAINGPLRGGKHSEWEGGFREPFIVRWPGHVPADTKSDQVICLTDMLATFASILHAPFRMEMPRTVSTCSEHLPRSSRALRCAKALSCNRPPQCTTSAWEIGNWSSGRNAPKIESVRNKRKAAQAARQRKAAPKKDELYNLREDPAETMNIAAANKDQAAKMKKLLDEARDRGFTPPGAG